MLLKEVLETSISRRQFLLGALLAPKLTEKYLQKAEYETRWLELQGTLINEINRYRNNFAPHSEVSISLIDLQTDARISLDGKVPRQPGCVINQFILYSLIEDFQKDFYPYEPLARDVYLAVGESKAGVARNLLIDNVGSGSIEKGVRRVNQLIEDLGLQTTFFDHPPAFWHEFSLQGQPNLMTTNEAVDVMAKLYRGKIFEDPYWTRFAIQRLVEGKRGLNIYIGLAIRDLPNVRVAHKVGYFPSPADGDREVDCDSGVIIINTPKGEIAYAMAIFSKGNEPAPPDKPSFVYNGWFTYRVSKLVYDFFEKQYL